MCKRIQTQKNMVFYYIYTKYRQAKLINTVRSQVTFGSERANTDWQGHEEGFWGTGNTAIICL